MASHVASWGLIIIAKIRVIYAIYGMKSIYWILEGNRPLRCRENRALRDRREGRVGRKAPVFLLMRNPFPLTPPAGERASFLSQFGKQVRLCEQDTAPKLREAEKKAIKYKGV